MANRQIRVFQRTRSLRPVSFNPHRPMRTVGTCARCASPAKYMPVDLARISGYLVDDGRFRDGEERRRKHLLHVGEAMAEAETVKSGELGEAYAETFRKALGAVDYVIEKAKDEGQLEVILTAAKVAGEIGKMQAAIADAIPSRGRGRPTKDELAERARPDIRDEDVEAALDDYQATKE